MRLNCSISILVLLSTALVFPLTLLSAQTTSITRASVDTTGAQLNAASDFSSCSSDGTKVAFVTSANASPADSNGVIDVYAYSAATGTTSLVSVAVTGLAGNAASGSLIGERPVDISRDGIHVAFPSFATDMILSDTNSTADVFVRNLVTASTIRVSVDGTGAEVAGVSFSPSISADGKVIAFASSSSALVNDDTNGTDDIFVRDLSTGSTQRMSVDAFGAERGGVSNNPIISDDGRYVAFVTSSGFVDADLNGVQDIYVKDRVSGSIERISIGNSGLDPNSGVFSYDMSGDARYVLFVTTATNIVAGDTNSSPDLYIRDRTLGVTTLVNDDGTGKPAIFGEIPVYPSIGQDGRYIAFDSNNKLAAQDTDPFNDIYLRDTLTGRYFRLSQSVAGAAGDNGSSNASLCGSNATAAFSTLASTFISGDTNGVRDILLAGADLSDPPSSTPTPTATATPTPSSTLSRTTRLTAPPEVRVSGRSATLILQKFTDVQVTARRPAGNVTVQYDVTVKPVGGRRSDVRKRTVKKNLVTFNRLAPGTYTATYTASAIRGGRRLFRTNQSPAATFTVG